MSASATAGTTAVLAALLALASWSLPGILAGVVVLVGVLLALGWAPLLGLPTPRGSAAVIAGAALAGAVVVAVTVGSPAGEPMVAVPPVLALALLAAFGHQLLRRDGRPRLVDSVSAVVTAQAIAVGAAAWIAVPHAPGGPAPAAAAAAAVAVAALVCAPPWPLRIAGPLSLLAGAATAAVVFAGLAGLGVPTAAGWPAAALLGAAAGVVVATWRTLTAPLPAVHSRRAVLAVAAAPVALCGPGTYVLSRFLLG